MMNHAPFVSVGDGRLKACPACGLRCTLDVDESTIKNKCGAILRTPLLADARSSPCLHRGLETRRVLCPTCNGRVQVKAFACALHGECTIEKPAEGVRACAECPDHKPPTQQPISPAGSLLLRFSHGLGDRIQFTAVLRHLAAKRPDLIVDVECDSSTLALYRGLCRNTYPTGTVPGDENYDFRYTVHWPEPDRTYHDSPSTKAEKHLREVHGITPDPALCRYDFEPTAEAIAKATAYLTEVAGEPGKAVLIHHLGSSFTSKKNLPPYVVATLAKRLLAAGYVPVLLDWQNQSPLRTFPGVVHPAAGHPLWDGLCHADPDTLCALARVAGLSVGIDSGPGLAFAASGGKTIIVWMAHHPVNYSAPNENVLHMVHADHAKNIKGDVATGLGYFRSHYRHKTYAGLGTDLADAAMATLGGQDVAEPLVKPPPEPIRTYSPDDFGGAPAGCLHFAVPAGIGDISWVYSKISTLRVLTGREVILSVCGDKPHRGGDLVQLLPNVRWGGYVDLDSWRCLSQSLPAEWQPGMDFHFVVKPGMQNLALNLHLENGRPLADFWPQLPTDYHYPLTIPPEQVAAGEKIMARLPRPAIAVYVSNRDKDRIKEGGWSLWSTADWLAFLGEFGQRVPGCGFVLLGAEWDRDKTTVVADGLEKAGHAVERVIAQPLGVALTCLRKASYFFSYPSGIGILANVLRTPGVMLLPRLLKGLEKSYADPADLASGAYRAWCDPRPADVLEWFDATGRKHLR